MRTWGIAAFLALAWSAGDAQAQFGLFSSSRPSALQPVGQKVGTPVGTPVATSTSPFGSTLQPIGMSADAGLSVAPVQGSASGQSFFSRFYANLASIVPFTSQPKSNTTGWFPSLGRRNRERHQPQPVWWTD